MEVINLCLMLFLFLLCLKNSLCQKEPIKLFKESLDGVVEGGNYTYFRYDGEARITLILKTHQGDADLYVSQANKKGEVNQPKFELESHDLQSATCGEDRIDVPYEFNKPIGIGIYGHPSHEVSSFTLEVIAYDINNDKSNGFDYMNEEELNFYEDFFGEPYGGMKKRTKQSHSDANESSKNNNNNNHTILAEFLLNLLESIFQILLEVIV